MREVRKQFSPARASDTSRRYRPLRFMLARGRRARNGKRRHQLTIGPYAVKQKTARDLARYMHICTRRKVSWTSVFLYPGKSTRYYAARESESMLRPRVGGQGL